MLVDMDIERDILNLIEQNPKKKIEIVKYCNKLGYNERTAYREIDRLEKNEFILFDKSDQTYFLLPYITSLKRNLLKQKEKGISQETDYSYNSIYLNSLINGGERVQVFANENIKISEESFSLISKLIRGVLLESNSNSIKDLNFEITIKVNLGDQKGLACVKNLKKTKWLPGIEKK